MCTSRFTNYPYASNCISSVQVYIRNWPGFHFSCFFPFPFSNGILCCQWWWWNEEFRCIQVWFLFAYFSRVSLTKFMWGVFKLDFVVGCLSLEVAVWGCNLLELRQSQRVSIGSRPRSCSNCSGLVLKLHKLILWNTIKMFRWFRNRKKLTSEYRDKLLFLISLLPEYYMRGRIWSLHVLFNVSVSYSHHLKHSIGLISSDDSDHVKE